MLPSPPVTKHWLIVRFPDGRNDYELCFLEHAPPLPAVGSIITLMMPVDPDGDDRATRGLAQESQWHVLAVELEYGEQWLVRGWATYSQATLIVRQAT